MAIVIAEVRYVIVPAAFAAIFTYAEILLIEKYEGPICGSCKLKMYAINIAASIAGTIIIRLAFIKLSLTLIVVEEAYAEVTGNGIKELVNELSNIIECNDPNPNYNCIFHRRTSDLIPTIEALDHTHVNKTCSINATINNKVDKGKRDT